MKNANVVTRELNNFLRQFGVVAHYGNDFQWYIDTNKIEWCEVTKDMQKIDKVFKSYLKKELGLKYNCNDFIISILHEVGHYFTDNTLTYNQAKYCDKIKEELDSRQDELTIEDFILYFNLIDERKASQWAVDYINNHKKEIKDFTKRLQPKLEKLYSL